MIPFLCLNLTNLVWVVGASAYAVYWTGRNTQREAMFAALERALDRGEARAVAQAQATVKAAIESAESRATWTADLPAGSVIEGIEVAGMQLVTAPMDARMLAPGSRSASYGGFGHGYPIRTDARIAILIRTRFGHANVVTIHGRAP